MKKISLFIIFFFLFSTAIVKGQEGKIFIEPERPQESQPFYVAGEVLVKFKEDPQMRPSSRLEQILLGRPKIKTNQRSLNQVNKTLSVEEASRILPTEKPIYKLEFPQEKSVDEAVKEFLKDPSVEFAEPNFRVSALWQPNDPYYQYQWNFKKIKSEEAWEITAGGRSQVIVAVLDTGVAYENYTDPNPARCTGFFNYYSCRDPGATYAKLPDFNQTYFVSGYDFVNNDSHPNDDNFHGTHVAATIAESTHNAQAATGLAFNVSLMPVKVLAADGNGFVSTIIDGLNYAKNHRASVINLSLGLSTDSQTLHEAILQTHQAGITMVASSGNESQRNKKIDVFYPAAYPEVIGVGAINSLEVRAEYSNYGASLDLVAPGGQMINDERNAFLDENQDALPDGILQQTINPGGSSDFDPTRITSVSEINPESGLRCTECYTVGLYRYCEITEKSCGLRQGTSMASPHVSAAAALLLSQNPDLSPSEIQNILQSSARDLGPSGFDEEYGHGLIDLEAALNSISIEGDLNNDQQVNSQDIKILVENWGVNPPEPKADLISDNKVNGLDFGKLVVILLKK